MKCTTNRTSRKTYEANFRNKRNSYSVIFMISLSKGFVFCRCTNVRDKSLFFHSVIFFKTADCTVIHSSHLNEIDEIKDDKIVY